MSEPVSASSPVVLAATHFPYSPLISAPDTICHSQDGQIAVVTRGELNIFTPALGIQVDSAPPATLKLRANAVKVAAAVDAEDGDGDIEMNTERQQAGRASNEDSTTIPLFRTSIAVEKKEIVHWGDWVNEAQIVTAGLAKAEAFWRAATWSPAGVGTLGGCALVALTNNCEVMMLEAAKNSHKGPWLELSPGPMLRLLGGSMKLVHRFRVADDAASIINLEWSRWSSIAPSAARKLSGACLAIADARGNLWNLEVSQDITRPHPNFAGPVSSQTQQADPEGLQHNLAQKLCQPDGRLVTQICWISGLESPTLVFSKLGVVSVITFASSSQSPLRDLRITASTNIALQLQGTWIGATPYAQCCGLRYLSKSRTVVAALEDGSIHAIILDDKPQLVSPPDAIESSQTLTERARQVFEQIRALRIRYKGAQDVKNPKLKEGPYVGGFTRLLGPGDIFAWHFSLNVPESILYVPNASVASTLVLVQLLPGGTDSEAAMALIDEALADESQDRASLTNRLMLPLHLLHCNIDSDELLDRVCAVSDYDDMPAPVADHAQLTSGQDAAVAFVESLQRQRSLEQLALKEILLRSALRHPDLPPNKQRAVLVAHTMIARDNARQIATRLASVLSRAQSLLQERELAILGRISLASVSLVPIDINAKEILPPDALSTAFNQDESCPACTAPVALLNIRDAACPNGHKWERCSITFSLIASTDVRTCVSCERKALGSLSPLSNTDASGQAEQIKHDVVNSILRAATCCLYCGGRWMRIR
ncbi:hypothetical protein OIO90_003093 [Microbotryomycetes sp. JL221]|nr:hypothetical protein OIO90_003093 [Microbotryomycetes sp. JL221]